MFSHFILKFLKRFLYTLDNNIRQPRFQKLYSIERSCSITCRAFFLRTSQKRRLQFPQWAGAMREKYFWNPVNPNRNQIVFTIFRLIWNQMDVSLDPKQLENGRTIWFRVGLIRFWKDFSGTIASHDTLWCWGG